MKVLVTGANGFTGSHLVKALVQRGDQVTALVRKSSNLSRLADSPVQLVYGDIGDRPALTTAMKDVDWVFHVAAYVELGLVDAAKMEQVNVEGTRTVLEVAQTAGIHKLVYCSTIGVYGDTQGQAIDETFQRTQTDFSSAYDRTKYQAQQVVNQFAAQGLPVVSVMPAVQSSLSFSEADLRSGQEAIASQASSILMIWYRQCYWRLRKPALAPTTSSLQVT
jgi:dihydroflavonol-4-reductase